MDGIKGLFGIAGIVLAFAGVMGVINFASDPKGSIEYLQDTFNIQSGAIELPDCQLENSRVFKGENGQVYTVTCGAPTPN